VTDAPSLDAVLAARLADASARHAARPLRPLRQRRGATLLDAAGTCFTDFAGHDYLGLAGDPRLGAAVTREVMHDAVGAGGPRTGSGDHPLHHGLEQAIADRVGRPRAVLFPSAWHAMRGVVSALAGDGDVVIIERGASAVIVDAARISGAQVRVVPRGDAAALDGALAAEGDARHRVVVVEGIGPVDGDVLPLAPIAAAACRRGAWLVLEDSDGVGVLGVTGGGVADAADAAAPVDAIVGTLGAAFAAAGGYVAGSATLAEWLVATSPALSQAIALSPVVAAAALEALHVAAREGWRRERVRAVGAALASRLDAAGVPHLAAADHLVTIPVASHREARALADTLAAPGVLVDVRTDAESGACRVRLSCSAAHTDAQVAACADALVAGWPAIADGGSGIR
jgi:8-amino-7-oxononanoate synthase